MASIQAENNAGRHSRFEVRLPDPTIQALRQYSRFLSNSSPAHIVNEALKLLFKDSDFTEWAKTHPPLPRSAPGKKPKPAPASDSLVSPSAGVPPQPVPQPAFAATPKPVIRPTERK